MRTYRVLWLSVTVPVASVGVAAAVATSSVLTVVIVFVMVGLSLGALSANLQSLDHDGQGSGSISRDAVVRHGCVAGVAVVAFYGLAILIGPVAAVVAAMAAGTCPAVVSRWRAGARGEKSAAGLEEGDGSVAEQIECVSTCTVQSMTDPELCMAWRRSFVELQRADSAETVAGIADFRRQVLDELERRSPVGFGQWIASGARAPSDPARYLLGQRERKEQ